MKQILSLRVCFKLQRETEGIVSTVVSVDIEFVQSFVTLRGAFYDKKCDEDLIFLND